MIHRLTRRSRWGTAPRRQIDPEVASTLARDLLWSIRRLDDHGRWLGPLDLRELALDAAIELAKVLPAGEATPVAISLALSEITAEIVRLVRFADLGIPGAATAAASLVGLVTARLSLGGTNGDVDLDGRSVMHQGVADAHDEIPALARTAEAFR